MEYASPANGYRLPTEAQWEYAAKGGNNTLENFTYAGSDTIDNVAWHWGNSGDRTHEVGRKAPNGLGIYDMSGNVVELCWDWYDSYTSIAKEDPAGASSGMFRVIRGGGYSLTSPFARSVYRNGRGTGNRTSGVGFRLLLPQF
jgi:formylglycine-generating enzyme required for sulfatase activity